MKSSRSRMAILAALMVSAALAGKAQAGTFGISFGGAGISGSLDVTYGSGTDATYPQAYEVTGITGFFSDANIGITGAPIGPLVPLARATPEPGNLLAPNDFSRFTVASGLPPADGTTLSYDNLLWPAGSPQTGSDYPPHGGVLDVYGLLFSIGGGVVVNFWSNGADSSGAVDYGVAVATPDAALDYPGGGISVPEPGSLALLGAGLAGLMAYGRRRARA